jgi:hypothetical protein
MCCFVVLKINLVGLMRVVAKNTKCFFLLFAVKRSKTLSDLPDDVCSRQAVACDRQALR